MSIDISTIDWRRVAKPQDDGYDIAVAMNFLAHGSYAARPAKLAPPNAPRVWPHSEARFVKLSDNIAPSPTLQDMAHDDPRVKDGLALLDLWPAGRDQSVHMMRGLSTLTLGQQQRSHGCTCGNYGDDWGWIYVTADNAWGFAEGIVHETGHWKLRAFGIWFEDWTDLLLLNPLDARYISPVRKDMERPMGAVLHGQYSYVHVAKMCIEMLRAEPAPAAQDIDWTALQLSRIAEGHDTLRTHAIGTPGVGELFLEGFYDWTEEVMEEGAAVIAEVKQAMHSGGGL